MMLKTAVTIGLNALLLAGGLWLACSGSSSRSSYPTRPVKLVVPFGAGGGTDTFARIMKKAIQDNHLLGQPLAIINVGGGGATIGSRRVKNAKPDGYTLLVLHDAIFTAKYSGNVDYGPEAFEPVAATGEVGMVIAVREDSPYGSLTDLMESARDRPGEVNFGANLGAMTHFAGLQLEGVWPGADFQFSQVGGGADRYADLKGGHIDVTGFSIEEFVRFREGGLRGLGYFGAEPHPAAPDVPPARGEDGRPLVNPNTFYWWVPKGTPENRVRFLADVLQRAMQTDYVRRKLAEIKCDPVFLRGDELRRHLEETSRRYAAITPPQPVNLPNFPALVIAALLCLSAAVLFQVGRDHRKRSLRSRLSEARKPRENGAGAALAAVCFLLTLAYVFALATGRVDFRLATVVYVLAAGLLLTKLSWRRLPTIGIVAQSMAFGLHFLLTRLFEVDLP